MTINHQPLTFSCFTEASLHLESKHSRMDPNESLGLFTCEHAAIVDLKQKNAPALVVRQVFPGCYLLVRYAKIDNRVVASVMSQDRHGSSLSTRTSWSYNLFHDHALRVNDLVGQTPLEWFVNTAVHEDVIERVDGDLGHDLVVGPLAEAQADKRELQVEARINRDEHAMMQTVYGRGG